MMIFGLFWIFFSFLSVGLGVSLVVFTAMDFTLALFPVFKIVLGIIWFICGIAMLITAIRMLFFERTKRTLSKGRNFKHTEVNEK